LTLTKNSQESITFGDKTLKRKGKNLFKKLPQIKWFSLLCVPALILLALLLRICVAYFLATDEPGDGRIYTQLAINLLEHGVFSIETQPPYDPTLIRLPGYPLFIATIYSIFGHGNDLAVRIAQALFDTATCVLCAGIAWQFTGDEKRRNRTAIWAFVLAALCPFTVIYVATLLTETLTMFLLAAMTLTGTLALKARGTRKSLWWWILTGLLSGTAVLLRPDSGLFAAGIGLTVVICGLFMNTDNSSSMARRLIDVVWRGAVFSLAFMLVLVPWTVRNEQVFDLFQPLAPAHAEMPGEFVPHGYDRWLRTWVDDSRFVEPMLWNLDEKRIDIERIPRRAFDSDDERERVAALLAQYNNSPVRQIESEQIDATETAVRENSTDSPADISGSTSVDNSGDSDEKSDANQNGDADENDDHEQSSEDEGDSNTSQDVKMTPEIDYQFSVIADERISSSPARYYVVLPVKRAISEWFDTHSLYYPFGGQLSPNDNLDFDEHQEIWLPIFAALMWIYTLLAIGGIVVLWRWSRHCNSLNWLLLILLMALPRIVFFSSVENPEPRYLVELFVFTAVLGGLFAGSESRRDERIVIARPQSDRLFSLDVFRGITIAAMVMVNSPGTWDAIYKPLQHAEWHGATPTDCIFPFFLFIVGVSISLALAKHVKEGSVPGKIYWKVVRRSSLIFGLGLLVATFPFYDLTEGEFLDVSTVRVMGVLQRIAVCYLISALIFLKTNWKQQAILVTVLLLVYWALMTLISVPGCEITALSDRACNLAAYVDREILTENHLWKGSKVYDPEGLLSTVPALATTLIGVLTGEWLGRKQSKKAKFSGMFFVGIALTAIGWIWSFWFPLNKNLWTSSYALYASGLALCVFGSCYWLLDIKGWRKWSKPFQILGVNGIGLVVGSSIMTSVLNLITVQDSQGRTLSLQEAIFDRIFLPLASAIDASLIYAVSFVLIWLFLMWLLYRKGIVIKT
jgi:predicted acyltransferase